MTTGFTSTYNKLKSETDVETIEKMVKQISYDVSAITIRKDHGSLNIEIDDELHFLDTDNKRLCK
jgi:DNA polymerase III sliding clamp (beta) subunit (PCNA family)